MKKPGKQVVKKLVLFLKPKTDNPLNEDYRFFGGGATRI